MVTRDEEADFGAAAELALAALEQRLDALTGSRAGDCFDYERRPGGVIEIECSDDGSRIIVNAHAAARELWLAARSGGFHFRLVDTEWRDTRSGETFMTSVMRVLAEQCGCQSGESLKDTG